MGSTVNECFLEVVERRGGGVAFLVKRDGAWRSFSYDWALGQVRRTAFGLRSLGYERGTRFAVLSENRPEWATTDYGAMAAGFVLVPLYTTLIPSQVAYILNDARRSARSVTRCRRSRRWWFSIPRTSRKTTS